MTCLGRANVCKCKVATNASYDGLGIEFIRIHWRLYSPPPLHMTGRSTGAIARLYTPPIMASRASTSTTKIQPIRALPAKSNVRCLIVFSNRTNFTPLFVSQFTRKVRTAGSTFKIVTNFIWRVGRGDHHRDPTLPPYGFSSHGVNSQITVFPVDTASRASRFKAKQQTPSLVPSDKCEPICAMFGL